MLLIPTPPHLPPAMLKQHPGSAFPPPPPQTHLQWQKSMFSSSQRPAAAVGCKPCADNKCIKKIPEKTPLEPSTVTDSM